MQNWDNGDDMARSVTDLGWCFVSRCGLLPGSLLFERGRRARPVDGGRLIRLFIKRQFSLQSEASSLMAGAEYRAQPSQRIGAGDHFGWADATFFISSE
jgi:hypothetical protein